MQKKLILVGILNVTPDSFSDGGKFFSSAQAILQAEKLLIDGADIIELGADSTRPGSKCVGVEEEWRRLKDIIPAVAKIARVSIDTHHAEVARRAIAHGASIINDVSAGLDPQMFSVVAAHNVGMVLMYSRCSSPHVFDRERGGDLIEEITSFLIERRSLAELAGIKQNDIILDSGFGAFISALPSDSFELVKRYQELEFLDSSLMLGCSRKGFLKGENEVSVEDRDSASVALARQIIERLKGDHPFYVRAHNILMHRQGLNF